MSMRAATHIKYDEVNSDQSEGGGRRNWKGFVGSGAMNATIGAGRFATLAIDSPRDRSHNRMAGTIRRKFELSR